MWFDLWEADTAAWAGSTRGVRPDRQLEGRVLQEPNPDVATVVLMSDAGGEHAPVRWVHQVLLGRGWRLHAEDAATVDAHSDPASG